LLGVSGVYVGHRGLSEKHEQVVGSVAKSVVDKAGVPVTIVK
jgi:nucleotide-binding universal stress UspA family protein